MNIFIPPLGTEITLIEPWKFSLYGEYRNRGMFDYLKLEYPQSDWNTRWQPDFVTVELPIGTILKVDRIYVRKGQKGFDSVTFHLIDKEKKGKKRFWAKLIDVNTIVGQII